MFFSPNVHSVNTMMTEGIYSIKNFMVPTTLLDGYNASKPVGYAADASKNYSQLWKVVPTATSGVILVVVNHL